MEMPDASFTPLLPPPHARPALATPRLATPCLAAPITPQIRRPWHPTPMPSPPACSRHLTVCRQNENHGPAAMASASGCPSPASSYLKVIARLHPARGYICLCPSTSKAIRCRVYPSGELIAFQYSFARCETTRPLIRASWPRQPYASNSSHDAPLYEAVQWRDEKYIYIYIYY